MLIFYFHSIFQAPDSASAAVFAVIVNVSAHARSRGRVEYRSSWVMTVIVIEFASMYRDIPLWFLESSFLHLIHEVDEDTFGDWGASLAWCCTWYLIRCRCFMVAYFIAGSLQRHHECSSEYQCEWRCTCASHSVFYQWDISGWLWTQGTGVCDLILGHYYDGEHILKQFLDYSIFFIRQTSNTRIFSWRVDSTIVASHTLLIYGFLLANHEPFLYEPPDMMVIVWTVGMITCL